MISDAHNEFSKLHENSHKIISPTNINELALSMWPCYLSWETRRNGDSIMSTIRRGEQMKRALFKASFLLAYRPSLLNFRALQSRSQ